MEALSELCDLIAKNPEQFVDKLSWICGRCPSAEALAPGSPRISRSQLNAVLAVAKFLSQCPNPCDQRPQSVVLEFIRSISSSFRRGFWPQSFPNDAIASFYNDFFRYVSKAAKSSEDFAAEAADLIGEVTLSALSNASDDSDEAPICRLFLIALSENFPPVSETDAVKLVTLLLDKVPDAFPLPQNGAHSWSSSFQSSPASLNYFQANEHPSPGRKTVADDIVSNGSTNGVGGNATGAGGLIKQQVASFEEETVESLERQEIAFKLMGQILEKGSIDTKLLEQVRQVAKRQLQSSSAFLKVRFF